ncbi:MAG: ATP-binding cassette domain-containing protein [Candidatus Eisenbacteria bacterium]|nr:ATP-binding cassette domain-containing protein [Candidatus Eisenbacteria bacterium]
MAPRPAVEMRGITKSYPGVLANSDVDLLVEEGEIHAIVGENGAGKSTLMKILYGLVPPDAGEIAVHGRPVRRHSPSAAIRLGLGMVHQHFMLVDTLTVAENVVLNEEPTRFGVLLDSGAAARRVERLSQEYGFALDPEALVGDLSVGLEQRVEIAKVLYRGARTLILDEPTGVLTPSEVDELFAILRALREDGRTILFITHKLDEVLALADRITVMRDGRVTGLVEAGATDEGSLARMMVGRDVLLRVTKKPPTPGPVRLTVDGLSVRGLRGETLVEDVSFEVRAGEILGVAGVQGNGQTELVEALTGLRRPSSGRVELDGTDVAGLGPRGIRDLGVSHVPEDRLERGLVGAFSVSENLALGRHHREPYSSRGLLDPTSFRSEAERLIEENDLRPPDPEALASGLSGGNQQKLIVARELDGAPRLLVASQPTRGVDIGAIEFVHGEILRLRDDGAAVVLVSSELSEILTLADRIAVMYKGRLAAVVDASDATEESIGLLMTGAAGGAS